MVPIRLLSLPYCATLRWVTFLPPRITVDVAAWLRSLGLERYEPVFRDNEIDAEVLPRLTAEDLTDLGVTAVGHRRKLLDAIAALCKADVAPAIGAPANDRSELTPYTGASLPEGERRQVTVLFADLTGYTALTRELGDEAVHSLMGRFFEMADGAIESFGGTIDKHTGDCVTAVFGAPVPHSNDSERAVRAAVALLERMPALSEELGRLLQVHVGIASGRVVTDAGAGSYRGSTMTGESVNLASRLTDEAGAGEVLISDAVRRALADRLECTEAGELAVKGFAEPIRAWRLLGIRPSAEPTGRRALVGRRGELDQIRAALAACRSSGRGQTILVRGEAGIGKTRLVEEFQREAEAAGFGCHAGLVLDFGVGTGRDVIRTLVRRLLDLEIASDQSAVRKAAETAVAKGLVAAERAVYLNDLVDLPQPSQLRALFDAMDNASRNRGKRETRG
jgi:class 3 adenylate cyclase